MGFITSDVTEYSSLFDIKHSAYSEFEKKDLSYTIVSFLQEIQVVSGQKSRIRFFKSALTSLPIGRKYKLVKIDYSFPGAFILPNILSGYANVVIGVGQNAVNNGIKYPKIEFSGAGANDLTILSGYNLIQNDLIYLIEIDSATTFKYSIDNGKSWLGVGIAITGNTQNLINGVSVKFVNINGRIVGDKWQFIPNINLANNLSESEFMFNKNNLEYFSFLQTNRYNSINKSNDQIFNFNTQESKKIIIGVDGYFETSENFLATMIINIILTSEPYSKEEVGSANVDNNIFADKNLMINKIDESEKPDVKKDLKVIDLKPSENNVKKNIFENWGV